MSAPAVIARYLAAAPAGDFVALADCFTVDGTVTDEGHTYRGRPEIIGWRESLASQFTYRPPSPAASRSTTASTGSRPTWLAIFPAALPI